MALEKEGKLGEAKENLKAIDIRFSFYEERLVYAKFLLANGKKKEAKDFLEALISEGHHMTRPNKKLYRAAIEEVQKIVDKL